MENLYVTGQAYWSDAQREVLGATAFSDHIRALGLRVRLGIAGRYLAEIEAAKPLTRGVATEGNKTDMVRVYFRLSASF